MKKTALLAAAVIAVAMFMSGLSQLGQASNKLQTGVASLEQKIEAATK